MSHTKEVKAAAKLLGQRGGAKSRLKTTPERTKEIARKAGVASGVARRAKRDAR